MLAYTGFEAQKMLAVRSEQFKEMSGSVGLNRFISNLLKFIMGKIQGSSLVLVLSEILSNGYSILGLRRKIKTAPIKPESSLALLKKYSHFPLYATFSNLFQLGLVEFPVIFYAMFYSPDEIGKYVLVLRILLQPLVVIGNSLGSVISKKIANAHHEKLSNRSMVGKVYGLYLGLGLVIFLGVLAVPPEFYSFVLGSKWADIKPIVLPLSILAAAKLSSGLHIYFYTATDNMRVKSAWKALQLGLLIASIFVFSDLSFDQILWITCTIEAAIDLLFVLYTVGFRTS
jgi:O-antigen/teichoic acid export membrane protein